MRARYKVKVELITSSGHEIFTHGKKLNQHPTVLISASFIQQKCHDNYFTQPLLETRLICID